MMYDNAIDFFDLVARQHIDEREKEKKTKKKELSKMQKRIAELDRIFKRIYEDDICGNSTHERFIKLSAEYETEQQELQNKVNEYQKETAKFNRQLDFDKFREIVRKYVGIKELTPTIVNEFIKKIVVHALDKSRGHRVQKIQIIFNCIGEFNPDIKENPQDIA